MIYFSINIWAYLKTKVKKIIPITPPGVFSYILYIEEKAYNFDNLEIGLMLIMTDNEENQNSAKIYYKNNKEIVESLCSNYDCTLCTYSNGKLDYPLEK